MGITFEHNYPMIMKTQQGNHLRHLKAMYEQVKDLKLGLLLAGFTVLVKDTESYANANGLNDAASETLRGAFLDMLNYDRYYWETFGPGLFLALLDAGLPYGIAKAASQCNFDLGKLTEPGIEHEWTRAPGWHCFNTYSSQIKDDILRDTDLETLKGTFWNAKEPYEPFAALTEKLARTSRFGPGFWYPLMLYLTVLIVKTDFRTLADSGGP